MLNRMLGLLSVLCLGAVVLFAFFAALGAFSLTEVLVPTIIVGVLGLLFAARALYVRHELSEHGNQAMLRSVNSLRERRGF
jgi:competence protein ComGC